MYLWVKYADDIQGNGMSDNHIGKKFVGIAENQLTPNESSNPSDYNWSPVN